MQVHYVIGLRTSLEILSEFTAILRYAKAAVESPSEASSFSNLFETRYEIGDYRQCIIDIKYALNACCAGAEQLRRKPNVHLVKSCLHIRDYPAAEKIFSDLKDYTDEAGFRAACIIDNSISRSQKQATSRLLHQVRKYLTTLLPGTEYYVLGYDDQCHQLNELMMVRSLKQPLALYFGNKGDVRNSCAAMIGIVRVEKLDDRPLKRKYHASVKT